MRVRVLVRDREPLVRAGLRAVLSADPALEVVGEATTTDHARTGKPG
jgi:DNA-binding NarL/FixJ family response regulator